MIDGPSDRVLIFALLLSGPWYVRYWPHRALQWWGEVESNSRNCEAQGKGRAKGRLRKVTQRSFIDYRLSIIDILSLELTLNLVVTFPPPPPPTRTFNFYNVYGL